MAQKETILGNYLKWSHFPLDCESMDYIQENIKHLAMIAQIAGCDKLIIKGCTGSPRTEGYVYVRTGDDLVGEILYYPGGTGVRCSIATDNNNIDTTANGETFANAYTKRKLVSGTTGTWAWSDFRALSEITNSALKAAVDGKAAASHTHAISNITGLQSALDGKAEESHVHPISNITELQSALDGKSNVGHTHNYSAPGHGHSISEVYNLQSALNGKSDVGHTHNYSAPGHTHDDRYYTKSDWAVTSGETAFHDNKYRAHWRRQGKVVTLWFTGLHLSNTNQYSTTTIYAPTPALNVSGVGFAYLGSSESMSLHQNSVNLMPFTYDTNRILTVGNFSGGTSFDATITYITSD